MIIEITSTDGISLFTYENEDNSLKLTLEEAVKCGINTSGALLNHADLIEADLSSALFIGARLSGANLSDAYMGGIRLKEADLSYANLTLCFRISILSSIVRSCG